MTDRNQHMDADLDAALTRGLEAAPRITIPADFAARVCASLPPASAPRRVRPVAGRAALFASIALTVALFLLAPHTAPRFTSLAFDMEMIVLLQLSGIAYWFAAKRES